MANKKLKLGCPEVAAIIDEKHAAAKPGWLKDRFLAIKLAAHGDYSAAKISELSGISRSRLFDLLKMVREGGLEAICERGKRGRREGWRKDDIPEGLMKRFEEKLAANEFATLQEARRWMREEYGVEASYNRIWYWAKKLKGVLLVPRPSHIKKKPLAAQEFRLELGRKLAGLGLEPNTRAHVWVMDEARFGLHTMLRKLWSMKGARLPDKIRVGLSFWVFGGGGWARPPGGRPAYATALSTRASLPETAASTPAQGIRQATHRQRN